MRCVSVVFDRLDLVLVHALVQPLAHIIKPRQIDHGVDDILSITGLACVKSANAVDCAGQWFAVGGDLFGGKDSAGYLRIGQCIHAAQVRQRNVQFFRWHCYACHRLRNLRRHFSGRIQRHHDAGVFAVRRYGKKLGVLLAKLCNFSHAFPFIGATPVKTGPVARRQRVFLCAATMPRQKVCPRFWIAPAHRHIGIAVMDQIIFAITGNRSHIFFVVTG